MVRRPWCGHWTWDRIHYVTNQLQGERWISNSQCCKYITVCDFGNFRLNETMKSDYPFISCATMRPYQLWLQCWSSGETSEKCLRFITQTKVITSTPIDTGLKQAYDHWPITSLSCSSHTYWTKTRYCITTHQIVSNSHRHISLQITARIAHTLITS